METFLACFLLVVGFEIVALLSPLLQQPRLLQCRDQNFENLWVDGLDDVMDHCLPLHLLAVDHVVFELEVKVHVVFPGVPVSEEIRCGFLNLPLAG